MASSLAWGASPAPRPPPEGFVRVADVAPTIQLDVRYATADNFTGAVLPGYAAADAWLLAAPAADLAKVQADLARDGLGLRIFDAYRPLRGTLAMVAWASRTGQIALVDNGYIARRSNHNRGNTVDLTLVDLATGAPLDMGTPFDTLTEAAHTRHATGDVAARRTRLVDAMRAHGWVNYWKEWWHFTWHPDDTTPRHRDVPYGPDEPSEGKWYPPKGWDQPDPSLSVPPASDERPAGSAH
ncbi:MAG: peptidase M15 [Alphaproteobacteria bacterium]|nr:peptidase M15 [Alphaproteobacteria bacterium]